MKHINKRYTAIRRAQRGFTLMEVLVTVLVIAIGLLGLAGLQAQGLQSNNNAYLRSQAMIQAYDMADRIRANFVGYQAGNYSTLSGAGTNPGCITSGCTTPLQIAQTDHFDWAAQNATLLPGGVGVVCIDSTPNDGTPAATACDGLTPAPATAANPGLAIKIWWDDNRDGAVNAADPLYVLSFWP